MIDKPRCRILVVEDEAMIAMLVEEMVGPAAKMDEALRLASDASLDAAILDVNVGGAVVYPVADLLRARGVPIIFATGYGAGELPSRFRKDAALSKPFSYEELAEALRTVLANQPCHTEQRKAALLLRGEHQLPESACGQVAAPSVSSNGRDSATTPQEGGTAL